MNAISLTERANSLRENTKRFDSADQFIGDYKSYWSTWRYHTAYVDPIVS